MSAIDPLVAANATYAESFPTDLPPAPTRQVAVLTCMDSRLHPTRFLGLAEGEAHVLRNAGGLVTDDVLRSLSMSQRLLGTETIVVIQHTNCGMAALHDSAFRDEIEAEVGDRPSWPELEFSDDTASNVVRALDQLRTCTFLPHRHDIHGFVFDVTTGRLTDVQA